MVITFLHVFYMEYFLLLKYVLQFIARVSKNNCFAPVWIQLFVDNKNLSRVHCLWSELQLWWWPWRWRHGNGRWWWWRGRVCRLNRLYWPSADRVHLSDWLSNLMHAITYQCVWFTRKTTTIILSPCWMSMTLWDIF